jgi:phosphoribosylformylglycinamidine synthase
MVYRIYVEKKSGLQNEANALLSEIKTFLGIDTIERVRLLNRYDAENITEELFDYAVKTVFSEPQLDDASSSFDADGGIVFATEYLL